jgi:diguanylate cyclase (GGDEF)-like protein/PAS domain S-box-containing protein
VGSPERVQSADDRLRRQTAFFELFRAVTVGVDGSATPEDAMQICIDELCTHCGWPVGHAYVVDASRELVSANVWHVDGVALEDFRRATEEIALEPGVGLPGRVLETKRPAWIVDIAGDRNFPRARAALAAGLRSGIAFPALSGPEVVAVLEFFGRTEVHPDDALLRALEQIGSQFGRAVERKRSEEALRTSEALKAAMLEAALDCVVTADHGGRIIDFNPAAEKTFRYARANVVGKELADTIIPDRFRGAHRRGIARYLATGQGALLGRRVEVTAMRSDGSEFPAELAIHAIDLGGRPVFTAYVRDITERKRLEQRLEHQAWHDSLTDLANRTLFLDRVEHALARSDRNLEKHSVIYLDLDNFKDVNDTLGHAAGDELLIRFAELLRARLRPGDTVARLGGDEFGILLEDTDADTARHVAERVLSAVREPVDLDDAKVEVRASLGVASGAAGAINADDLLRRADEAMYEAKAATKESGAALTE